jgi:transposase-like protein
MATGRKSEAKREAVALALASGKTAKAAAAECGVGERTVGLWLADDAFRRRVGALRGEMVARATGRMADGMTEAADQLRELLTAESESVRLGAARSLLELGVKLRESTELEERLADLERRTNREAGK